MSRIPDEITATVISIVESLTGHQEAMFLLDHSRRCSKLDSELKNSCASATALLKSSLSPWIWRRGRGLPGCVFKDSRSAKG